MYCRKCGNKLEDGDVYCKQCHTRVQNETSVRRVPIKRIIIAAFLILLLSFGGRIFLIARIPDEKKIAKEEAVKEWAEELELDNLSVEILENTKFDKNKRFITCCLSGEKEEAWVQQEYAISYQYKWNKGWRLTDISVWGGVKYTPIRGVSEEKVIEFFEKELDIAETTKNTVQNIETNLADKSCVVTVLSEIETENYSAEIIRNLYWEFEKTWYWSDLEREDEQCTLHNIEGEYCNYEKGQNVKISLHQQDEEGLVIQMDYCELPKINPLKAETHSK